MDQHTHEEPTSPLELEAMNAVIASWEEKEFNARVSSLKLKAEAGDMQAMKQLGDAYYRGVSGNGKNTAAALPYWQKAVDNGELSVASNVAYAYYTGDGCRENEKTALHYYTLAAETYDPNALFAIGLFHEQGIGCWPSNNKAIQYYEKAALAGHGQAQFRLGLLLFTNKRNNGLHWLCCAHLSGVKEATEALNGLISSNSDREVIEYQIKQIEQYGIDPDNTPKVETGCAGCYVATCVYGSYDCPQVWTLRRFRDETLAATFLGRAFIRTYYAVSPTIVKWFGKTDWFQTFWRDKLDQLVRKLQAQGVEDTPYHDKKW